MEGTPRPLVEGDYLDGVDLNRGDFGVFAFLEVKSIIAFP